MIKLVKNNLKKFVDAVLHMEDKRVYVGVPGNESSRGEDMNNASLAYIHDKGSPKANIPARPFLRPGIEAVQDQIEARLRKAASSKYFDREVLNRSLEQAGLIAETSIKKHIVSQAGFLPLQKATLEARRRKGFKGTKALIRTGKLLNSIKSVVRTK